MARPRGIIFDLDGTLYCDDQPIPGAAETVEWVRRRGHPIVFMTNAIESAAEHADKLERVGVRVAASEIVNSTLILVEHLRREMPSARVYPMGDPPLMEQLGRHFSFSQNPAEIDVVVVGTDCAFDYRSLCIGCEALSRGARFWATHADPVWPTPGGLVPDAGTIIAALETATGRRIELVAGKPSTLAAQAALDRLGRPARDCVVVGDNLKSDIALGRRAGMTTALVLTGVTSRSGLGIGSIQPDHVLASVVELPRVLAR